MKDDILRPVARTLLRTYQVRIARSRDLADALSRGTFSSWSHEEIICKEGGASDSMEIILKGKVKVLKLDASGVNRELATLDAPTMVGQMGLVDGSNRSASCVAEQSVGSICISKSIFKELLAETSLPGAAFRHLILSSLAMQLTSANQKIRNLIMDMEEEKSNRQKKTQAAIRAANVSSDDSDGESSSVRLMKIAGVLDGWNIDTKGLDDIKFVEDDDMRRTREARESKRR